MDKRHGVLSVFIGRPFNYVALIGGQTGVEDAINLLMSELRADMSMLGEVRQTELEADMLVDLYKPKMLSAHYQWNAS